MKLTPTTLSLFAVSSVMLATTLVGSISEAKTISQDSFTLITSRQATTPVQAIPLAGVASTYASVTAIPTVVVPTTYGGGTPYPEPAHVPTQAWVHIPPRIAHGLAEYLFPVNNGVWTALVGPRGMVGSALIGNDGSEELKLSNGTATLQFDTAGASFVMAAGQEADLFSSAWKTSQAVVSPSEPPSAWTPKDLLHPATIRYQEGGQLAQYAYRNALGQDVYGFGVYAAGSRDGRYVPMWGIEGISFRYTIQGKLAASWAPWILSAAQRTVFMPIRSDALKSRTVKILVGSHAYLLPIVNGTSAQGLVLPTGDGLAWVSEPNFLKTSSPTEPLIPDGAFTISVAPFDAKQLTYFAPNPTSRVVAKVAPWELSPNETTLANPFVSLLQVTDRHWLLYRVSNEALGAKVAQGYTLDAVDLNAKAQHVPIELTRFRSTSTQHFFLGSQGTEVVYDQSATTTSDAHTLMVMNLATDHQHVLPPSTLEGAIVRWSVDGHRKAVTLHAILAN